MNLLFSIQRLLGALGMAAGVFNHNMEIIVVGGIIYLAGILQREIK